MDTAMRVTDADMTPGMDMDTDTYGSKHEHTYIRKRTRPWTRPWTLTAMDADSDMESNTVTETDANTDTKAVTDMPWT